MNSRERILAVINHAPVDRIPTDIWATAEVWKKLNESFGDAIKQNLHIDGFGGAGPEYIGPSHPSPSNEETTDMWGIRRRNVNYGTGNYSESCHHPLGAAQTIDDLETYPWPQVEWFDYSKVREKLLPQHSELAIKAGYMAPFYLHNQLRGLEQSLMDPLMEPEFTHHLLKRLCDYFYDHHRKLFESADGLIDVAEVTDDYGSQTAPLISLELFNTFYRPHLQRFIDLCHEFGIRVFHHDDGAIRPFIPPLVEMGVDILNPIQWTCPGMDRAGLKKEFGHKICFHGAVENQRILPFGTPDEVRAEVRQCIDSLASDRTGYILCSCHNLQSITPVENIIAMYDEAHRYGAY